MTKKEKSIIGAALSFLIAVVLLLTSLVVWCWIAKDGYQSKLENQYQKNYLQLKDNFDDLEVDLSKLIATTSYNSQKSILQSLYTNCVLACDNLSGVPLSSDSLYKVNEIVNRLGGYAYTLLNNGAALTSGQMKEVEQLHKSVSVVKYDLNSGYANFVNNGDVLSDASLDVEGSSFTAGLVSGEAAYSDVPSLIYDGPFSESVVNKVPKSLEPEISETEARGLVYDLLVFWEGYTVSYSGQTNGRLKTYNFDLVKDDVVVYVQILANGGKLLSVNSKGLSNEEMIDVEEGISIAESVAYQFGFDDMYVVWHQRVGDLLYVNLAPIVDGVIYYPDLVKAKLDLRGGVLLGWEATSYVYNHEDRDYQCSYSIVEGQTKLSPLLKVEERNYCIVPNEFVGESYSYEYVCTWEGYKYYIYLDANTGEEINIMRVVHTDNGDLLM
ncbi:MAG: germination protein YpeB [Clostridia bacterium]|nr:germination protein YpeB [Clostridia bacterium]